MYCNLGSQSTDAKVGWTCNNQFLPAVRGLRFCLILTVRLYLNFRGRARESVRCACGKRQERDQEQEQNDAGPFLEFFHLGLYQ